jgi:glycosyltransferase involved in cell wall biosynthesis
MVDIENLPLVSVLTPTYNRREFIPNLIKIYEQQLYPKNLIEFLILDDGEDKIEDLMPSWSNLTYYYFKKRKPIGWKRNFLNQKAKGEIIICMDDDDYYFPERISHAVKLLDNSDLEFAGLNKLLILKPNDDNLYHISKSKIKKNNAWTDYTPLMNGGFAYKKTHLFKNSYNNKSEIREEIEFLDFKHTEILYLDPNKTMIGVAHKKSSLYKNKTLNSITKKTDFKIKDIIRDDTILDFYLNI